MSLVEVLEAHAGRGVVGADGVWHVRGNSSQVELFKVAVLEEVCRESRPFVHYEESPAGAPELAGTTESHGVWQLPMGARGKAILKWLYLGNWQLYIRTEPLSYIPDLCRSTDSEIRAFLAQSGADCVIDSFHDDVSWVVAVRGDA
jgi:hypothetical protein